MSFKSKIMGIWLPLLGGAMLFAAVPPQGSGSAEGVVVVARGYPVMLADGESKRFLSLAPSASLVGLERLLELLPGDRVKYSWSKEVAGVRVADVLEVDPAIFSEAPYAFGEDELMVTLQKGAPPLLLDVRAESAYKSGHIKGAKSCATKIWQESGADGPSDKNGPVVVYGESQRDGAAQEVARGLISSGYKDVKVLKYGIRGWIMADHPLEIEAADFSRLPIDMAPQVIADVRPRDLLAGGTPEGAVSIPMEAFKWQDFDGRIPMRTILLVGSAADEKRAREMAERIRMLRSARALRTALRILILRGGFESWLAAGLPVEKGVTPRTEMVYRPADPAEIAIEDFERLWQSKGGEGALFLDVRRVGTSTEEWVVKIPLEELPARIGELPRDKEILTLCSLGERSRVAAELLRANGFRARFLRAISPH